MTGDSRTDNTLGDNTYYKGGHPTVAGAAVFTSYLQPAIQAAIA